MGAAGVALNSAIVLLAGSAALGVFNQVYAVYVVASQLAAFGLHDAAQKHVAEHATDPTARSLAGRSALRLVARTGLCGAVGALLLAAPIGWAAGSPEVGRGVACVAP